ncbi:MAG: serine/threonine protein kinase [Oscillatoriales cyanobacterium SM2_2_1]|nr:serine/threonine protein kinase [Oscillatoriales cyanobacterium SM2_2_1]
MEEQTHNVGDILLDRYQILSILGQGGLGITYRALRLGDRTQVAIKSLALRGAKSWKAIELFEREAKVLANLHHPAIPSYVDYFEIDSVTDRRFYIVQELVEGQSLSQMMDNGWHGAESEIQAIAQEILNILTYLHGLRPPVVHRDIKPQNIIRRADGRIFLVDFGAVQDTYRQTEVGSSTVVGTYGFMAPEQFRGKALPQTDLYALGATVIYLLTGDRPPTYPKRNSKSISTPLCRCRKALPSG